MKGTRGKRCWQGSKSVRPRSRRSLRWKRLPVSRKCSASTRPADSASSVVARRRARRVAGASALTAKHWTRARRTSRQAVLSRLPLRWESICSMKRSTGSCRDLARLIPRPPVGWQHPTTCACWAEHSSAIAAMARCSSTTTGRRPITPPAAFRGLLRV